MVSVVVSSGRCDNSGLSFYERWYKETGNHGDEWNEVVPKSNDPQSETFVDKVANFVVPVPVAPETNEDMLWNVRVDILIFIFSIIFFELCSINLLNFLAFNSITFDDESSQVRGSGLLLKEFTIGITVGNDFLVLIVEKRTVEEIVKVSNDSQGQEIHHNINVSSIGDECNVIYRFDDKNHRSL